MITDTKAKVIDEDIEDDVLPLPSISSPLPSKVISISKNQYPPPFLDLIYGYHANDILNGRGATINIHPGNQRFRALCASRKEEFDSLSNHNNVRKRQIALEIVQSVLEWHPPGRFLERVIQIDVNYVNGRLEDDVVEAFFREVDLNEVLTGHSAKYFTEMGLTIRKNRKLMRELGPWKEIGTDRAIQKVCGVIRDYKRPDRIAMKAMGLLREKKEGKVENANDVESNKAKNTIEDEDATRIVPTDNDVLLGRGAFINDHLGNRRFRILALEYKVQFDDCNPSDKRKISAKIVELTKVLTPPGRFLKRASNALQEPVLLPDGKYDLPPRGLEGPWEEVPDEQACAKALQVLRDLKAKVPTFRGGIASENMSTCKV